MSGAAFPVMTPAQRAASRTGGREDEGFRGRDCAIAVQAEVANSAPLEPQLRSR